MPISDAQKRASRKYDQKAYDKVLVLFKKGEKEKIKAVAQMENKSINGYITGLIMKDVSEKLVNDEEKIPE